MPSVLATALLSSVHPPGRVGFQGRVLSQRLGSVFRGDVCAGDPVVIDLEAACDLASDRAAIWGAYHVPRTILNDGWLSPGQPLPAL